MILSHLMAFEGSDTFPAPLRRAWHHCSIFSQFPHFDSFVKTTADQGPSARCEGHRIDTVFVTFGTVKPFNQYTSSSIPDSDTFIKGSSGNVFTLRRDSHCSDAIFNTKIKNFPARFNIPNTNSTVTTSRCYMLAVASKVERIYILFMSGERVSDRACCNIPNLDD